MLVSLKTIILFVFMYTNSSTDWRGMYCVDLSVYRGQVGMSIVGTLGVKDTGMKFGFYIVCIFGLERILVVILAYL